MRAREQGRFLSSEEKEAAAWHTFQGHISARPYSRVCTQFKADLA